MKHGEIQRPRPVAWIEFLFRPPVGPEESLPSRIVGSSMSVLKRFLGVLLVRFATWLLRFEGVRFFCRKFRTTNLVPSAMSGDVFLLSLAQTFSR